MTTRLLALLVCLCIYGCGDDDDHVSKADAGTPKADAGGSKGTTGAHKSGAGTSKADAGSSTVDFGVPRVDAGASRVDAGTHKTDAGGGVAGASEMDAGANDSDAGVADAGAPPVVVEFNLKAQPDCTYSWSSSGTTFFPDGLFDVSGTGVCEHPYVAHLLLNSVWKGTGGQTLTITSAKVTLIAPSGDVISYSNPTLPNPFVVSAGNVTIESTPSSSLPVNVLVAVELVPVAYRAGLDAFPNKFMLAKVELTAKTSTGDRVAVKPFVYPIEICLGCLVYCNSYLTTNHLTRQDLVGDHCDDNSATDDHVCIVPGC
jgi:hypothetical protein